MSYPCITFRKSAERDVETLHTFATETRYDNGRNLAWAVFNKYPFLKAAFGTRYAIQDEKTLRRFVHETYQTKDSAMKRALAKHEKRWERIAKRYFALVDGLFGGRRWPKGKYIAFGTIWGMYPRFLETKTFQIPYWHRTPRYVSVVIAHELLHFMFYDYFYRRYPRYSRPKHNFFVWHVSEIFNTIVQNPPTWRRLFKLKSLGYPEHKKIVQRISLALYRRDAWNLDGLVEEIEEKALSQKLTH